MVANVSTLTYTPVQVGEYALAEVRACMRGADKGIALGLDTTAQPIVPLRPGNLAVVQAYTSHGKTAFMTNWARRVAHTLREAAGDEPTNKCVVYVSWEDTVEDLGLYDLANETAINVTDIRANRITAQDVERLEVAAFKRGTVPVWVIGNSHANRKRQARLTLSQVSNALKWIEDAMRHEPAFLVLDYLNKIQPEKDWQSKDGRRTDLMELVFKAGDLGMAQGCPVVLGAQSGRQVMDRPWKAPRANDPQETSSIEQYCQLMLSLWRPVLTEAEGSDLRGPDGKPVDPRIEVTQNLLIMTVNKQKRGPAGGWIPLYMNPATNEIRVMARGDEPADAPPPGYDYAPAEMPGY